MGEEEDTTTIVIKDIDSVLSSVEREAQKKSAALLVVGGDLNGTLFDLSKDLETAGRIADNTIPLEFEGISRYHMKITNVKGVHIVEDSGSKNGTFVNNKKLNSAVQLVKGDIIKLGSVALKYLPKGDPERLTYDKLSHRANCDLHTGCYNKAYFNKACDLEVKKSKVTGDPLSLILFDLDHFKHLNDTYGHDAGDFVLKDMALIVRKNGVRDNDVFARYGGEEFVILLPKANLKHSYEVAERLRKTIELHQFMYEGHRLPVKASVGVADYREGVTSGTDLFKRADIAVYKAKRNGRNQVQFFKK